MLRVLVAVFTLACLCMAPAWCASDLPLNEAARKGQVEEVARLIKAGADVNARDKVMQSTALYCALDSGKTEIIDLLLQAGADINAKDIVGCTPLNYAVRSRTPDMALYLIDKGADVNIRPTVERCASTAENAIVSGHLALVERLIKAGLDLKIRNAGNRSLLHAAVVKSTREMVSLLLANGLEVNQADDDGYTPIFFAAKAEMADLLVAKGAFLRNAKNNKPLIVRVTSPEMVDWCMAHGQAIDDAGTDGVTALMAAAGSVAPWGERLTVVTALMDYLLKKGANPNIQTADGATPLHAAALQGYPESLALLLKAGAKPDVSNKLKQTPLLLACNAQRGSEKVKALLEAGANPNITNADGNSALYLAVQRNDAEMISAMLAKKANPNLPNQKGETPFLRALDQAHPKVIPLLLDGGGDANATDANGYTALCKAIDMGSTEMVARLFEHGATTRGVWQPSGDTPLHRAAATWDGTVIIEKEESHDTLVPWMSSGNNGDPAKAIGKELVAILLQHDAPIEAVNTDGNTPLCSAARSGNLAAVQLLLARGVNIAVVNKRGETPLRLAVTRNSVDIARLLIEKGVKPDNALFFAARRGEIMDYLVTLKLDPNTKDAQGQTPLLASIWLPSATAMEQLLAHGADPAAVDARGRKALTIMQEAGRDGSIIHDRARKHILLLSATEKPDITDASGVTLLHAAAALNQLYVANLLLKKGLDINILDPRGETPLFFAVRERNPDAVRFLLERKCQVNVQNKLGQTPLYVAVARNVERGPMLGAPDPRKTDSTVQAKIVGLLLAAGASPTIAATDKMTPADLLDTSKYENWSLLVTLVVAAQQWNYRAASGLSLLHLAAATGMTEAAQRILDAGGDLNVVDKNGRTPLHTAMQYGGKAMIDWLLTNHANPNTVDNVGATPLHVLLQPNRSAPAVLPTRSPNPLTIEDQCAIIQRLIDSGADVNARDRSGNTPLGLTRIKAVRDLLKAKGANE